MQIIERDNPVFSNLRKNISTIGSVAIQKKLKDIQRQQALEDYKRKLEIQKQMGVLNRPTTSISISEIPYSERLKVRDIAARKPEEYYRLGMAKGVPGTEAYGWQKKKGFSWPGLGEEFIHQTVKEQTEKFDPKTMQRIIGDTGLQQYGKYILSPEALSAQAEAEGILKSPYRTTRRLGYRGGDITDIEGMDIIDEEMLEFDSIEEAEAANLPAGTIVYIQGRKAVIE